MTDDSWRKFFSTCARVLGAGRSDAKSSASWCAWTTFASLRQSVHYWSAGIPDESELGAHGTSDGGTWGQPFLYADLAHVIVPGEFYWEHISPMEGFTSGTKRQDLEALSAELTKSAVAHRKSELVVEVKLY
jgi:hypothetical protein